MASATPGAPPKKPRRTPRACDRCRLKRVKCDGMAECQPCAKSDSLCLYTHQRNSASRNYHWQMRDVMNEALRRMYVACQNRSGFPGTMPAGSETDDKDVSVQAILEGLGLIAGAGGERLTATGLGAAHEAWRVPGKSGSMTPPQSTDDALFPPVQEHVPAPLRAQCRMSHDQLIPSPVTVPAAPPDEYPGTTPLLSPHQVHSPATYFSHPVSFYQAAPSIPPHRQTSFCHGGHDDATQAWLPSTATPPPPPSAGYDLSFPY